MRVLLGNVLLARHVTDDDAGAVNRGVHGVVLEGRDGVVLDGPVQVLCTRGFRLTR